MLSLIDAFVAFDKVIFAVSSSSSTVSARTPTVNVLEVCPAVNVNVAEAAV